jgi:dienelactone hydrolase
MAVDGVYDAFDSVVKVTMPPPAIALLDAGKKEELDAAVAAMLKRPGLPTSARWGIEHGLWSFQVESVYECFQRFKAMSMSGIASQIKCPSIILDAEGDEYFGAGENAKSQPELLAEAIGDGAKLVKMTTKDAAAAHCHIGAAVRMNQILFDWFEDVVS